ncbi:hypothetical protein NGB36_14395 [Streptomyces sp. RB6PN25]|uniref:Histidine kinase n=1 Tax=Streptomyces humicola TaxID=2953240 RepID=A0ABT1PVS3_9ACTN|nr:hypothetical protein [Streptomyces humicola]MCQ4081764.1 hypothetical protein [Streptomyces humicola]
MADPQPDARPGRSAALSALGLPSLAPDLTELSERLPHLLEAVVTLTTGLDVHETLRPIVETAADLAGARYAGLGVIKADGNGLADFVTHGVDEAARRPPRGAAAVARLPRGPRRAEAMGGTCSYGPGPDGAGTTVVWEAPL